MSIAIKNNTIELQSLFKNIDALPKDETYKSIIDGSITNIKMENMTTIKSHAFENCKSLLSADFQNVVSISEDAFSGCYNLQTINFPNLVTMGQRAFYVCGGLTSVNFPKLQEAAGRCFRDCSKLVVADFAEITYIGNQTFCDCNALTALIIRNTEQVCTLNDDQTSTYHTFLYTPIASGAGYIYVPSALIEDYKVATNWSTYAAQFRALEDYTVDGTVTGELDETKI